MKILSLQKGEPSEIEWKGEIIRTSFVKKSAGPSLKVHLDHIEGDSFALADVHGAIDNVIYAFSKGAYTELETRLGQQDINVGSVGENLTLSDLDEKNIFVGDCFSVGSCEIQATFPRIPCTKFNIIFQNSEAQKQFQEMRRPGVYFRVLKEGEIRVGDELKLIRTEEKKFPISEVYEFIVHKKFKFPERVNDYLSVASLPEDLRRFIAKSIKDLK